MTDVVPQRIKIEILQTGTYTVEELQAQVALRSGEEAHARNLAKFMQNSIERDIILKKIEQMTP